MQLQNKGAEEKEYEMNKKKKHLNKQCTKHMKKHIMSKQTTIRKISEIITTINRSNHFSVLFFVAILNYVSNIYS